MTTTIAISDEVWMDLNKKKKVGESFEDVLKRLLKIKEEENEK
jgi:predicted CopG family antitoxin